MFVPLVCLCVIAVQYCG